MSGRHEIQDRGDAKPEASVARPTASDVKTVKDIYASKEPTYSRVGDVSIFGVHHGTPAIGDLPQAYEDAILEIVVDSGHLLLEGTTRSNLVERNTGSYEDFARSFVSKERGEDAVHYLEDGYDRDKTLQDLGVPTEQIVFHRGYGILTTGMVNKGWEDPENLNADLPRITAFLRENHSSFGDMSDQEIATTFHDWSTAITKSFAETGETGAEAAAIFNHYSTQVREEKVIIPKVVESATTLDGPKAVFIGKSHVEGVRLTLIGEPQEPIAPWPDYVKALPPEKQVAVQQFFAIPQK